MKRCANLFYDYIDLLSSFCIDVHFLHIYSAVYATLNNNKTGGDGER